MLGAVGTASNIEIVWTAFTFFGFLTNLGGFIDAIADWSFLKNMGLNGTREIVARWHMVLNGVLTYVQLSFLVVGVLYLFTPEPPSVQARVVRVLATSLFLLAEPLLVLLAIYAHRYRQQLGRRARSMPSGEGD